ncbi:MAG: TIGR03936 family radical SAM-associated protein [Ruminococcus sp.]|nr:TIGR03936 family radical SAM-associated protein [Ruminococcus sp.]
MKNIRVWFKKDNECRYISHLDLNRCMLRALHKSRIPIWHTEGFNIHPYATFPLPLSLGFKGERECMDIRLVEDCTCDEIKEKLNSCLPEGLRVFDVAEPVMKAKEIAFASFRIRVTSDDVSPDELYRICDELLGRDEILVEKKTKKKGVREIDIKGYLDNVKSERNIGGVIITVTLPAGSVTNINPTLIQKALERYYNIEVYFDVTKTDMYDKKLKSFE